MALALALKLLAGYLVCEEGVIRSFLEWWDIYWVAEILMGKNNPSSPHRGAKACKFKTAS